MIIVNLKGGLGNQMFQYALGRALSLKNNAVLKLDTSGLDRANAVGDIYRPFALDAFTIAADVATEEEVRRLKYPYGLLSKIMRGVRTKLLRQTHIGWEPQVLTKMGDLYLDGFWQSPKYFADIRDTILKDFTLVHSLSQNAQTYAEEMRSAQSVSVHIRRGDYTTAKNIRAHGMCSLDYYKQAVSTISERLSNPVWFIFSDDIDWVRTHLPLTGACTYVSGSADITDAEELILMSTCAHNIIANSSFSWWGAWLNANHEKLVVAPTPWFNASDDQHKDLLPETWITLPRNP